MTQSVLSFMVPQTHAKAPRLADLPSSWKGVRRLAWDIETRDDRLKALGIGVRRGGYIAGWSFSIEDGPAFYLPVRHALGGNCEWDAMQYMRDRFAEFDGTLLTCGGAYDLDYGLEEGVKPHPGMKHRDVALDEALCDEFADGYDLESMLRRYDLGGKDEEHLVLTAKGYGLNAKSGLWQMPGTAAIAYGIGDVAPLHALSRKQDKRIEEQNLWGAVETESALLPVVVRMRRRGVAVDESRLDQFGQWAARERDMYFERFRIDTGVPISLDEFRSAKKLDAIVYRVTGKHLPVTAKGNPESDEETVVAINHPAFRAHLVPAKRIDTVIKTFYKGTVQHLTNGRIHATFKQIVGEATGGPAGKKKVEGAKFGRMAGNHTNLQNQKTPKKDPELGGRWMSVYVPDSQDDRPHRLRDPNWVYRDLRQVEPRHCIHWAEFLGLQGAREVGDRLRADPNLDIYAPLVEDTGLGRDAVKVLYLAQSYNQGEASFCGAQGLPVEIYEDRWGRKRQRAGAEGRALLDRFNARAPYIRLLAEECQRRAKSRGFLTLLDGARSRFPVDGVGNYLDYEDAMNRLLQGGSGRQIKKILIAADAAGLPLQIVVHDAISLSGAEHAPLLTEIMENTVKLSVPVPTDGNIGRDYAEASGYGKRKVDGKTEVFRPTWEANEEDFMESFQWVKK